MKISVLTPTFNSEKTIKKNIESVLAQTYTNWEHIVVDGNSNDNTIVILKKYSHLIWVSEKDRGQSDAMNKAFKMCTGDVIVYLNSDDYFYPDAFKNIIDAFLQNKKTDIVVGNLDVEKYGQKKLSDNATISWKDLSIIKGRFPLNPVSYFYKKALQIKVGEFPIHEHYTMDYWFLLRAFYLGTPYKIDHVLGCFLFSEDNKTAIISDGFSIQKPIAIRFCLKYTPKRIFYVYGKLLLNKRNKTGFSKVVKTIYKVLRKI